MKKWTIKRAYKRAGAFVKRHAQRYRRNRKKEASLKKVDNAIKRREPTTEVTGYDINTATVYTCKKCGQKFDTVNNYCPNCGTAWKQEQRTAKRSIWDWVRGDKE